jgi:DNA-binding transcriptional ArsR family regulator
VADVARRTTELQRELKRHIHVFAALGDETRVAIIAQLSDGKARSISRLTDRRTITRQAVTKHLEALEGAGLVRRSRLGRESLFTLDPNALFAAKAAMDRLSAHWDDALARLKQSVESDNA